jgi:hypothetical protein
MLLLILRILFAGILIESVTQVARLSHRLGAVLLFVPIAIPVVFLIMFIRDADAPAIFRLSRHALLLIPLSLPMFIPLAMASRWGLSFYTAQAIGIVLAAVTIAAYLWLGPRMS